MVEAAVMEQGSSRTLDRRASAAWLRRFARTTPGVVGLIAITVAAICVIAGLVCGGQLDGRIAKHREVLDQSEPLAYSAQNLYAALSAADAAAASAFLSGDESGPVRVQYQRALADAAAALADVTAGATDPATRAAAAELSAQLMAYTGLVEAARSNSRQGFPVGSAYLREASSLMQTTTLPGAEKIFTRDLAAVDEDQRAVGTLPLVGLALLAVALAAIAVGSVLVYRRTNRQFNIGLMVAAGLVVVVGIWMVAAIQLAAGAIDESRTEGTAKFAQLAKARILAQQARTDETLLLITRGDITASEKSFGDRIAQMNDLLNSASSEASNPLGDWTASHRKQVDVYLGGDYAAAVDQAIGGDPNASAAHFAAVESGLRGEIEETRATLRDGVSSAGTWLTFAPTGALVLMAVAAVAAVVGLWPRLKEFL
ncbi:MULTISPECIES: hypothetical protein [unclassified Mycobacterium]|uniref:hypothetical protein n=1 Tax=unclassified Mycobacterium TaxID=2642494 RepID=UPI0029C86834|nr:MULTISPECIES: hypothetical protein [unclassified Mycobacterium]